MKRALILAIVAGLVVPACDLAGDADAPTPSGSPAATSPPPTLSADGFLYTSKDGIRALAAFDGDRGTLEFENDTGAELAAPGLYLLDAATGELVEATVTPSRPVADGGERTFRVALERPMPPAAIGLVVLTIGADDHGAFLPPAAAQEAA